MKKQLLTLALGLLTFSALQAQNLWDIISGSPVHTTLTTALEAAGLEATLNTDASVDLTIWAPTDAAFDALPAGLLNDLLADPSGELLNILLYHVTPTTVFSFALVNGDTWPTLQGSEVTVSVTGGNIFIDGAQVVAPNNIDGEGGGVVHSINAVLLPPAPCEEFLFLSAAFLPDAPVKIDGICSSVVTPFPVWAGDFYTTSGFEIDIEYVASICSGGGAGSWDAEISVFDELLNIIATTTGCELTFTVPADGTYSIGISEVGACGDLTTNDGTDNGILTLTCISDVVDNSIWSIVQNSDVHNTLEVALEAAGLDGALSAPGAFTLFAPTDAAFAALGTAVDDLLLDPTGALANVLLYHLVSGVAFSTDLTDGQIILTAQGETVEVTITGGSVFINGVEVVVPDIAADNGVVHVLDAVLLPEFCTAYNGNVNNFVNAGGAPAPDADGVCPVVEFTAFGVWASEGYPVNNMVAGTEYTFSICDGFGAGSWDAAIVVQNSVTGAIVAAVEGCEVTWTAETSDDIVIIIHEVGTCGSQSSNTAVDNGSPSLTCTGSTSNTVVDIIVNSPDHTTLENLVILAELDGVLSGDGPFTVFAPTDAAFASVEQATLDALLADPFGLLTQVLTYHVASGAVFSTDLSDGDVIPTLNGEEVTIGVDFAVTVGNSNVTAAVTVPDLAADNGVVHVIDAVLIPLTLNVDNIVELKSLNIFPNPTNQQFTVDVNLAQTSHVTIDIVNLVGQTVRSIDLSTRAAGLNREYIDVSSLPSGFYLMNITVGDSQIVTKVQVMK